MALVGICSRRCSMLYLCVLWLIATASWAEESRVRIALFHMKPVLGKMIHNTLQVQKAMRVASNEGVDWMATPELALTGYRFTETIGVDWIKPGPDRYVEALQAEAKALGLALLLGHLEQLSQRHDPRAEERYNTLFVIDRNGEIVARHRKINTIPVAEDWSRKGHEATVAQLDGINVGLMICADAWPSEHALALREAGAQLLINSATWPPGEHGPGDTWEKRSRETGLPVFVNNRTGKDFTLDTSKARSVLYYRGQELFSHASDTPALIILDWNISNGALERQRVIALD